MEVHHHPHVGQKKFKEYFLEGLMIFLAVTMGFFAEQYREYVVDRSKEKEIIHSLIKDLEQDKNTFSRLKKSQKENVLLPADSVKILLSHPNLTSNDNSLYVNCRMYIRYASFYTYISTKTITQLRNINGFNLIENESVVDSIDAYYSYIDKIRDLENNFFQQKQAFRNLLPLFLKSEMYDQVIDKNEDVIYPTGNLKAKNISNDTRNELLIKVMEINGLGNVISFRLYNLDSKRERLSAFIKKVYHLN